MANIIYLTINGNKQGLISRGASALDSIGNKYQKGHENEILIFELSSNISIRFKSITWEHVMAGTSAYSIWDDRSF